MTIEWRDAMTLEEMIRERFSKNRESDLIEMIKLLPPGLRDKCRRIWIEEQKKRRKHGLQDRTQK